MKFNKYPHDEQICKLSMESCEYEKGVDVGVEEEMVDKENKN